MSVLQNKRVPYLEKPSPGCMGRMINLFDLSSGPAANRLLMEKPHRDSSPNARNRVDVTKKAVDSTLYSVDRIEEKLVEYELRRTASYKNSGGTPMKMLIEQEMSKEIDSKQKPPGVVARLMGLDALPAQQSISQEQRNNTEGHLRKTTPHHLPVQKFTHSGAALRYWQQENELLEKRVSHEMHPSHVYDQEQQEYKDVYEVWQSSRINKFKPQPPQKGRYAENLAENKMALVRQKFMEAKRLATDDKLRQSQEFQDALEVLSSNRDIFLKFLQEPNSLFSKQLQDLHSIPPPPQSKRITVLKPSKNLAENRSAKQCYDGESCIGSDMKSVKQKRKQDPSNFPGRKQQQVGANERDKDNPSRDSVSSDQNFSYVRPVVKADNFSQATRIVVLKPSPGKAQDIKALVSSPTSSPRFHSQAVSSSNSERFQESATDGTKGSREIAKEITRQMQENLSSDSMHISKRRDEILLSSALSNGYVGDESSFNKSENDEYLGGNLSDSEVTTPTSRHSWDYINKFSPYSSSSFSRASGSPESSVSREAKKRLSERWAMVASGSQEQRQIRRTSSTLGEMLALAEIKKPTRSIEEISDGGLSISSSRSQGEEASREPTCLPSSSRNHEVTEDSSPRNLSRSRSVPVSSTVYEKARFQGEVPEAEVGISVPKQVSKLKNGRSFKGKFSNLFFSRNRKSGREKPEQFSMVGCLGGTSREDNRVGEHTGVSETKLHPLENRKNDDNSQCVRNGNPNGLLDNVGSSYKASPPAPIWVGIKEETRSSEGVRSRAKPGAPENSSENQGQPSPVSVLELPFEDDLSTPRCSDKAGSGPQEPLESVTQSLSWNERDLEEDPQRCSQKAPTVSLETEEEQEKLCFVRNVLSASGFDDQQCEMDTSRWYLPNYPLDPLLLEKFGDKREDNKQQQEAKRRQRRSERRLLFDSVNAALVEIAGPILDFNPWERKVHKGVVAENTSMVEEVWGRVIRLFSSEAQRFSVEGGQVDLVARKEAVGPRWAEMLGLEMDGIGRELENALMGELLEDAVSELICEL